MGKGMDRKKEEKKKPAKTLEEKRAAKKEKKQARVSAMRRWQREARDAGPAAQS